MHLFPALFLLFLAFDRAPEPLVLEAPDSAFAERLAWAQSQLDTVQICAPESRCDDVAINVLALNSMGRFDLARPSLVLTRDRTALWVLAGYDYWLGSGDHAFVREQWAFISNALGADTTRDGGVGLAAANAVVALARARNDTATLRRSRALLAAAERRAQEAPGIFGPAFSLVDADQAEAELTFLADSIHARWPLATGLVALGLYEYHREAEAFALLRNMARRATSSASMFVLPLVRGLVGWDVDAPNRALAVEPHLPAAWNSARLTNLRVGAHEIDLQVSREAGVYSMQLGKSSNTPLSIRLAPALPSGARVTGVTVNEADAPIQVEETQHDVHVVIETTLRREVEVRIEYTAPRPRRSVP
jgi:hypothetical protein